MLADDPIGEPIYLLVPDQATLLYERMVAEASPTGGYLRVHVTTFRKLTERVLSEAGGEAMAEVTPLGRRILIGRLLRRLEPELTFYRSTARQPGLAGRLDSAFSELENSDASDASIESLAGDIEAKHPQSPLPAKLRDIRRLFAEYEKLLGSDRLDPRRRQKRALDAIAHCPTLPHATLFVDGFYDLTRPERQMLYGFANVGCRTTIALDVDPRDANAAPDAPLPATHPLRLSTHAYRRLSMSLRDLRIGITLKVLTTNPRFASPELLHLERNFEKTRPGKLDAAGDARLIEVAGRRAEVDAAARQIVDWLAAGMRLRDILVLARDVGEYESHVEASFREHRIPHFIDRQEPAGHQPLIRAIRGLMQLALSDWSPDRVLELLKSGLVGIEPDVCDAVENYVVAHRIRGRDAWAKPWRYRGRKRRGDDEDDEAAIAEKEDVARMNEARRHIVEGVEPLLGPDLEGVAPTGDWCQRICRALDRLGVRARLATRIAAAEEACNVEDALRSREVWHEFSELLDQLCTVLSGEALSLREFSEVVDVALERFVLAIIPPTIDQVLVGSVDRTRSGPVRACIVLGLNEGQFPRCVTDVDAFSDDDRKLLADRDVEVRAGSRDALLDEQFLAYLAVTRPSERLTLIRSSIDEAGKPLAPSIFWTQAADCFRGLATQTVVDDADAIATPAQLVAATIRWATDDRDDATSLRLTRWLFDSASGAVASMRQAMLRGVVYDNRATLSPDVARRLFPSPIRGSATRLETFAACPFKHFAQHALRLSPREEADFTRMEVGTMYHRVLEDLVRDAIATRHDLVEPIPDLDARIHALGRAAALELREELLLTPGRTQHLIEVMERTLRDVADTQRQSLALGAFRPTRAEMSFGNGETDGAPPLTIDTPAGHTVELRGKVDRIDTLREASDAVAATVIDYKLSGRPVSFDRIYHGLSLQLVTYLLVLSSVGEKWIGQRVVPAAALYVKLSRDVERVAHPSDAPLPATPDYALHKSHKARGIIDDRYAGQLDATTSKGSSPAYSIYHTDKPIELKRQDVLEHETFARLVEWSREKVAALVDEIAGGHIEVRPYRMGTETPCAHCDYRAVCRLDLAFNRYYLIEPSRDEKLRRIAGVPEAT